MANRTAWTAGNGQGLTYGTLINSADMVSLPTGSTVMSSVADIANGGTTLDQFMDISFNIALTAATTLAAGSNLAFWIYNLNQDGSHYGDGQFTSGTQTAGTPSFSPTAIYGLPTASTSALYGTVTGIVIPPGSFRMVLQQNAGTTLSAGTQTVKYRTYNIQTNN